MEMNEVLDKLPRHLMELVIDQPYNEYTAQDHALWRYVMRQNVRYLGKVAHGSYLAGLKSTGVSIDQIPHMYGMNRILKEIGWAAVAVDGFIPPAAFMEFQAYKVLVIAADIRPIDQIEYTPAPDIIHEAAGHAPIIADPEYAEYLRVFGRIGSKAFSSSRDYQVYEAVRHLSILKADPYTPKSDITRAEEELKELEEIPSVPSEMSKIRNLHWWTVEYGLIGDLKEPKIYGAGLLSSIGESYSALQPDVIKLPYNIRAADYNFDITTRQPQLFVTPNFQQLTEVLEEYADTMSLRQGGIDGVLKAIDSNTTATVVYSSGIEVSGTFNEVIIHRDQPVYLRTDSPTTLNYGGKMIGGHSREYHSDGFGSPVGKLDGLNTPLETMSDRELTVAGIVRGESVNLSFESGITVQGRLKEILRMDGKVVLLSFMDCKVQFRDRVLFEPAWGVYDMAIGSKLISAYSGPSDPDGYGLKFPVPKEKTHKIEHTDRAQKLHNLYADVCRLRESKFNLQTANGLWASVIEEYPDEWLIMVELLELFSSENEHQKMREIQDLLEQLTKIKPEFLRVVSNGLEAVKSEKKESAVN